MLGILLKLLFFSLLFHTLAYGYVDSDFDGVSDERDACPNTPFSDLVDARGCSIKKVPLAQEVAHLSLIIGSSYNSYATAKNKTKTLSQSLQLDYEIKKIKVQLALTHHNTTNTPYHEYDDASFGDTRVSVSYDLSTFSSPFSLYIQGGLNIPNYQGVMKNNKLDIFSSLGLSYFIDNISLFGQGTYTIIGDSDTEFLSYQNKLSLNLGLGYTFTPSFYSALSWFGTQASIKSGENSQSLSWFSYLNINPKLYTIFSLAKDLDKDVQSSSYSIRLGYRI